MAATKRRQINHLGRPRPPARGGRLSVEGISGTSAGRAQRGDYGARLRQARRAARAPGTSSTISGGRSPSSRGSARCIVAPSTMARQLEHRRLARRGVARSPERVFSPYQLNPMNLNPLRDLLADHLDVAAIQACERLKLFVCATNVETGHARIFTAARGDARTRCSPRPACPSPSRPSRSTGCPIGTAATWATR